MRRRVIVTIAACALVLAAGALGNFGLAMLRKPPAQAEQREQPLHVEAVRAVPETVQVKIIGYGEVHPRDVVQIAPEVAGRVVQVHPRLDVGEVVPEGEPLFVIDQRTYDARLTDARAAVDQLQNSIKRLRTQWTSDRERLKTLKRSLHLAKTEFERVRQLFEQDQVGTQSAVDAAERAYNTAIDQVDQLERALAVYPIQVQELENSLAAAQARFEMAQYDMERTTVTAPFDARIKEVRVEKGQYVTPGAHVLTLADDSVLELSVPLDSRDARRWLQFSNEKPAPGAAWFRQLKPVPCRIFWTEDSSDHYWEGLLHRVEQFDEQTRTLTVAVRLEGADALSKAPDRLPLVEGMFCLVEIPGRKLESAFRLPRTAVTFQGNVYVARDNRLQTVPVELAYERDGYAFVAEGLAPGDLVVVTRLVNPLENALLDVHLPDSPDGTEEKA